MALTDIDFTTGEVQDFLLEIPLGTVNPVFDIQTESESDRFPVVELAAAVSSAGDIFIVND